MAARLTVKAINSELGKGTRRGWRRQPDTFTSRAARQTGSTGRQSAIRSGHEGGGGEAATGTRGRGTRIGPLAPSPIVETCRTAPGERHSPTPKALRNAPKSPPNVVRSRRARARRVRPLRVHRRADRPGDAAHHRGAGSVHLARNLVGKVRAWLESNGRSPAQQALKTRLREVLRQA